MTEVVQENTQAQLFSAEMIGDLLQSGKLDDHIKQNIVSDVINDKKEDVKEVKRETLKAPQKKEEITTGSQAKEPTITLEEVQIQLSREKKTAEDSKKWSRDLSRKMTDSAKMISSYIEEGILNEEEGNKILTALKHGVVDHGESQDLPPIRKFMNIANNELENIRRYTEDELLDKKINSFDYFLREASQSEMEEVVERLSKLQDDPVKLTKEMLAIGNQFYEDSYKHIEEVGGVKELVRSFNSKIENLQKKIDKQEEIIKKLKENEDYISTVGYDLPSGAKGNIQPQNTNVNAEDIADALASGRFRAGNI